MSGEEKQSSRKSVPTFAKVIMLLQTGIIFFLSFWMYEEFQRNIYLQAYVTSLVREGDFLLIIGGFSSFFTALVTVLYVRLHRARRDLHEVLSAEAPALTGTTAVFLDRRMEEHLLEMIRKKNQAENLGATGDMPVLKRVEQGRDRDS